MTNPFRPIDPPTIGSDAGEGFVYVGQENDAPYRLTVDQAQQVVGDLLWHIIRALRGDDPDA